MLELLDNLFRFGAITCSVYIAVLIWRDAVHGLPARLAVLAALTNASYMMCYWPGLSDAIGAWMLLLLLVCIISPIAIWLFCLSLFDDSFRLSRLHYVVGGAFKALCIGQYIQYYIITGQLPLILPSGTHPVLLGAGPFGWLTSTLIVLIKVVIVCHLLLVAWSGRDEDLVEKRRQFRMVFVSAVSVIFAAVIINETWLVGYAPEVAHIFRVVQSGFILAIMFYLLMHMTRIEGEWVFGKAEQEVKLRTEKPNEQDRHDLLALEKLVKIGALLEQGMTISSLASAALMPEHRLRRLINQHLGYRNFSDYINHHRVEAAKSHLADVDKRHVPVLTVAMTLGYGSLGPFNRAFKERAGMTPTEFRKKALADF
ncbi:AraC family transcriptional regulator [Kordiimonas pumila]|uniref:Helix-turn-helix domain-containing protein n=1 Tax=Kordiimonas pumila TaxID=2161677 RepID=A0ABV7D408_9PROT|nr:helix-turn-helix domain-containing protein [Kordiimonas pumila]